MTRRQDAEFEGCEVAHSLQTAVAIARTTDELPFIIGGASLYEEALPHASEIYLTEIDEDFEGDVTLSIDMSEFEEVERVPGETKGVTFRRLRRMKG